MSVDKVREVFRQQDLERLLNISVRTIQRRRLLDAIYKPDYIDDTGHPIWTPPTVKKILAKEKGKR